jgi:polar amino acid transport system substrate-binding protein
MLASVRIFVTGLLALCGYSVCAEPVEFRVAYEDKDTPDHTGSGDFIPEDPGILVELVKQIQGRVPNLRILFSRRPWARCLSELEAGTADAVFSSSFKPERLKIGVYPMKDGKEDRTYRIDTKSYSLYKLRESSVEWDGSRIGNVKSEVAAMRGYAVVDDLKKMGVTVREVNNSESGFRMLMAGRVDGFAQLTEVGDYTLKKYPAFSGVVRLSPPLVVKDYYLQISHPFQAKYPELTLAIWKALADIRRTELERLTAKYMRFFEEGPVEAVPK